MADAGTPVGQLLKYEQVAALLGVHHSSVWRAVQRGDLTKIMIGGAVRFDAAEVEALIERGRRPIAAIASADDA